MVGQIVQARFKIPVFLTDDREFAFVFMTDDNTHALAIARLGDVDQATQTFVSSQPYTVGVLFSSSNRQAWTAHQDDGPLLPDHRRGASTRRRGR